MEPFQMVILISPNASIVHYGNKQLDLKNIGGQIPRSITAFSILKNGAKYLSTVRGFVLKLMDFPLEALIPLTFLFGTTYNSA